VESSYELLEVRYIRRNMYMRRDDGQTRHFVIRRDNLPRNLLTRDLAMDMLQEKLSDPGHSGPHGKPKPDSIQFVDHDGQEVLAVSAIDVLTRLPPQKPASSNQLR
jgi:hypothetical protein